MTQVWLGWSLGKNCRGGLRRFAKMEKYFLSYKYFKKCPSHTSNIKKFNRICEKFIKQYVCAKFMGFKM